MTLHVLPNGPGAKGVVLVRKVIRTDNTEAELDPGLSEAEICALINAKTLDTVKLRHMGDPLHIMFVDDDGYETELVDLPDTEVAGMPASHIELRPKRARKPLNVEATRLYHLNCRPDTEHQIVGDVVILPDQDFAEPEPNGPEAA
jgi:hypothetical protein